MEKPNFFRYATSELSQDAFLAWLIRWADDSYASVDAEMCQLGKSLLLSLLKDGDVEEIHTAKSKRQWKHIDVYVKFNENSVLAIEDKIGTSKHDDQLNRYRKEVEKESLKLGRKPYFVYIKTENEPKSVLAQAEKAGYKIVCREDLLNVLNQYSGQNQIVTDFRANLQRIEDAIQGFCSKAVKEWKKYEWQGFYKELEKHVDVGSWSYVANPAGGFWGLWWNYAGGEGVRMYLQFEQERLCVKIECKDADEAAKARQKYYKILMSKAKEAGIKVTKPARFGSGEHMTIGNVDTSDIFGGEGVDIEQVVKKLKGLEQLVTSCMKI